MLPATASCGGITGWHAWRVGSNLIDFCIAQLQAQGPSRTCIERNKEEEDVPAVEERRRVEGLQGYLAHKKQPLLLGAP